MHPLRPEDPRRLGPYRLLRRVGAGGMGVVFLAVAADGTGDDLAAVKAVRAEYAEDAEFRARFAGEVALARRVRGPYTARVLDADTEGRRPWLATEYVAGPALHQAVREGGPFPEESLRALAAGLARALEGIHSVGLVHRDLKPSNVLLSTRGPQVIDFGIARATEATALTRTGQTLGTPAFMSPEQATGAPLGPGSDLFAFGGVLLFAGTGRQPFGTGDPAALLYRVVNEEPDLSGLPEGLLPLVTACLSKDPDERPGLEALLADLTGTALPEAGADDPTAWLPTAVATRVRGTMVYTRRQLPAPEAPEDGADTSATAEAMGNSGEQEAPETDASKTHETNEEEGATGVAATPGDAPAGAAGTAARDSSDVVGDRARETGDTGESGRPEREPRAPIVSELPGWALTRPTAKRQQTPADGEAEGPEETGELRKEVPAADQPPVRERSSSPADGAAGSRRTLATASAQEGSPVDQSPPVRPSPAASPYGGVFGAPEPTGFSSKSAWGAALAVLALVVGLVLFLDTDDSADDDRADASTPAPPEHTPRTPRATEEDPAEIQEVAFLSEERFAVLSSAGVHLYETDRTEPVERLLGTDPSLAQSTLVSDPDSGVIAVQKAGGSRSTAIVWDLDADEEYQVRLAGSFGDGEALALSPGGRNLYVGHGTMSGRDGKQVIAYDTHTGEELYAIDLPEDEDGLQGSVSGLGTTPDGRLLIGALNSGIAVWDASTGRPVPGVPELRRWSASVSGPLAVTDGLVATASYSQLLLLDPWSQEEPKSFEVPFDGTSTDAEAEPWITSLSFGEDGNTVVAAGHVGQYRGFLHEWGRDGTALDEEWNFSAQYRTAQASPSGGGVLVAPLPMSGQHPNALLLLDGDLRIATEYELPTVTDEF